MSRGFIIIFELGGVFQRLAAFVGSAQIRTLQRYQVVLKHIMYNAGVYASA